MPSSRDILYTKSPRGGEKLGLTGAGDYAILASMKIGCHLSASGGYLAMAQTAVSIGANVFQFFTRNPRGGAAKPIDKGDVAAFLEFAEANGIPYEKIPLNDDLTINVDDYTGVGRTVFIANPNAPTGLALSTKEIESIAKADLGHIVLHRG